MLIIIAMINRNINQGIDILPERSRNINMVTSANGIIHKARVSFTIVAVCKAIAP